MNGHQRAVLWIGLLLVAFNLVRKWSEISAIIFSGAGGSATPSQGGGSSGGGNSIQIPVDPFIPFGPKITVPLPKL